MSNSRRRVPSPRASLTIRDLEAFFEEKTPSATAESWDNVGLLVGSPRARATGVVICDDLTRESIDLAKRLGYSAIVNHHPCIFPRGKGLASVTARGPSELVFAAASAGIAVLATHTNFDQCALEVPIAVSKALGFTAEGRLIERGDESLRKLVVFVPKDHVESVRSAIAFAGAGQIGNYDTCTFGTEGEGTFRGLTGANPFLGRVGELERAPETRLETVFPKGLQRRVLAAMKKAHPYEEVAYDIYPVHQSPAGKGLTFGLGYGVYGSLKKSARLADVTKKTERAFRTRGSLITEASSRVTRVAFVAGKGSSFMGDAIAKGCDLFITGEAGYHDARVAASRGLSVIELGHRESEYFFLRTMGQWMRELGVPHRVVNTPLQRFSRG